MKNLWALSVLPKVCISLFKANYKKKPPQSSLFFSFTQCQVQQVTILLTATLSNGTRCHLETCCYWIKAHVALGGVKTNHSASRDEMREDDNQAAGKNKEKKRDRGPQESSQDKLIDAEYNL